jgi:hypothetical protein
MPAGVALGKGYWRGTLTLMLPAYREYRAPGGLESVVSCLWRRTPGDARTQRVVPDGCVDLIWFAGRELFVVGADTGPREVELVEDAETFAVRLRPGAAGSVLGTRAAELCDRQVALAEVWGDDGARLEEALARATGAEALELLARAVTRRAAAPDPLASASARCIGGCSPPWATARRPSRASRACRT